MHIFERQSICEKLSHLDSNLEHLLSFSADTNLTTCFSVESPNAPVQKLNLGRDIQTCRLSELPEKPGLKTAEGQARLLHDLASIELQAMELCVRTLVDFPTAPSEFRMQLAALAKSEARHLEHCLSGISDLGLSWGAWPVQTALWDAVTDFSASVSVDLIDRVLLVHRYLEASGLDAGESILRRLSGIGKSGTQKIVDMIVREEVQHVEFGSAWFFTLCREQGIDPGIRFTHVMQNAAKISPRRERLAVDLRLQAGFTTCELQFLEAIRVVG